MEKKLNVIVLYFLFFWGLLACMEMPGANDPRLSGFSRTTLGCSTNHVQVSIDGNAALDAFPDKTGSGTQENPYVIENLKIDAGGGGTCIAIQNTTKSLVIRNCTLIGAITALAAGIYLNNCIYIKITNCSINHNALGINLKNGWGAIVISNNNVSCNVVNGIALQSSYFTTITTNIINQNNGTGIFLNDSIQSIIHDNVIHGNKVGAIDEINSIGDKIYNNDCGGCDTLRRGEGLNVLLMVVGIVIAVPLITTVLLYRVTEARKHKNREGKVANSLEHATEETADDT